MVLCHDQDAKKTREKKTVSTDFLNDVHRNAKVTSETGKNKILPQYS